MLDQSLKEPGSFLDCLSTLENPSAFQKLANDPFNWQALIDQASKLSISALVYDRVNSYGMLPLVPQELAEQLRSEFLHIQVRNMFRFYRLKEVLQLFSTEHIPVIVLKGAALAELVYPKLGLRPMNDVDLLIKEEHISRAEQLLQTLGYYAPEDPEVRESYHNHHHIVPYVSPDRLLTLEIHHHLIPSTVPVTIPNQDLWQRARSVCLTGVDCWILSPEDFLIHLALHTANDRFFGKVRVMYDIKELMRRFRSELDWERLLTLAQEYEISKFLYYILWLAQRTVGAEVPEFVLKTLRSRFHGLPWEDRLLKSIFHKVLVFHDANHHPFYIWTLNTSCLDILSKQGRAEKLQNIFHRSTEQYQNYTHQHAQQADVSTFWYRIFGYPVYLLQKFFASPTPPKTKYLKKS